MTVILGPPSKCSFFAGLVRGIKSDIGTKYAKCVNSTFYGKQSTSFSIHLASDS